jgi:hypothetical protein
MEHLDEITIDCDTSIGLLNRTWEPSMHRVVSQKIDEVVKIWFRRARARSRRTDDARGVGEG